MHNKQKAKKRGFTLTLNFLLSEIKTKVTEKRKTWCGGLPSYTSNFSLSKNSAVGNKKKKNLVWGFTHHPFAKKVGGFTLVEMMVSLGIFAIVLSVSVGALLSMVSSNRKTQSLRSAMDNLNLAMEEMSRNIIQGRKYHCGAGVAMVPNTIKDALDCAAGGEYFLAIEAHDGVLANPNDQIVYRLDSAKGRLEKSFNSGSNFDYVTAPSIFIDNLTFYVSGNTVGDDEVPRVIITIGGTAGDKEGTQSSFDIQTMATQRVPE